MLGQSWVSFELQALCNSLLVIVVSSVIYSILPDSNGITNLTSSGKLQYTKALIYFGSLMSTKCPLLRGPASLAHEINAPDLY